MSINLATLISYLGLIQCTGGTWEKVDIRIPGSHYCTVFLTGLVIADDSYTSIKI